jgi:hypothetical protein
VHRQRHPLKPICLIADIPAAMIDRRLLDHWTRQRTARQRLRDTLPPSWRNDPRPGMAKVREVYIEGMLQMWGPPPRFPRPVAIGDDDR